MAAWTAPRTWTDEELVTQDHLNEQLRDNLLYVFALLAIQGWSLYT